MDHENASYDQEPTPLFNAYRRGYDPEQVDRYVADQRRRLDEAQLRASEAERKLAAAVGQLRELHRRITVLEAEERPAPAPQPPAIDTLGERVQRILQEAWDGANALRQTAAKEADESREAASSQAAEIVAAAKRKAEAIEEEIERRRSAYLERIEEDRTRALSQLGYLNDQRKAALKDLVRTKSMIENTIKEFTPKADASDRPALREDEPDAAAPARLEPVGNASAILGGEESLPPTMPVHRLPSSQWSDEARAMRSHEAGRSEQPGSPQVIGLASTMSTKAPSTVFDFEEQQPS